MESPLRICYGKVEQELQILLTQREQCKKNIDDSITALFDQTLSLSEYECAELLQAISYFLTESNTTSIVLKKLVEKMEKSNPNASQPTENKPKSSFASLFDLSKLTLPSLWGNTSSTTPEPKEKIDTLEQQKHEASTDGNERTAHNTIEEQGKRHMTTAPDGEPETKRRRVEQQDIDGNP